jgi:hypothetical protein
MNTDTQKISVIQGKLADKDGRVSAARDSHKTSKGRGNYGRAFIAGGV